MSSQLARRVRDEQMPPAQKLLLLVLVTYSSDGGQHVFPYVATMAGKCGQSQRVVRRSLQWLWERGYLQIVKYEEADGSRPTEYRITVPAELSSTRLPRDRFKAARQQATRTPRQMPDTASPLMPVAASPLRSDTTSPLMPVAVVPDAKSDLTGCHERQPDQVSSTSGSGQKRERALAADTRLPERVAEQNDEPDTSALVYFNLFQSKVGHIPRMDDSDIRTLVDLDREHGTALVGACLAVMFQQNGREEQFLRGRGYPISLFRKQFNTYLASLRSRGRAHVGTSWETDCLAHGHRPLCASAAHCGRKVRIVGTCSIPGGCEGGCDDGADCLKRGGASAASASNPMSTNREIVGKS